MSKRRRGKGGKDEPRVQEEPRIILFGLALKMLETLQPNIGRLVMQRIEVLKDPLHRRGSIKIQGRPANDPMFRIESGNYRIFYKRVGSDIHVVDIRHRQGAYKKG